MDSKSSMKPTKNRVGNPSIRHLPYSSIMESEVWYQRLEKFQERGHLSSPVAFLHVASATLFYAESKTPRNYLWTKEFFDRVSSLGLLILMAPMLLFLGIFIKISDPRSPVMFKQLRMGRHFEVFEIYKFRTMHPNAEVRGSVATPLHKTIEDQRSTWLGSILRKWKIDELPQLWNVLRGQMSLVGPRPLSLDDSAACPIYLLHRFAVKPGMTGMWQALHPNTIPWKKKFRLDAYYVTRRGLTLDLYLLWRTVFVVLRGEHRYKGRHNSQTPEQRIAA